jgi:hypothetical protein
LSPVADPTADGRLGEPFDYDCQDWAGRYAALCDRDAEFQAMLCEEDLRRYEGMGCAEPWVRYQDCVATEAFGCDINVGETDCEAERQGYFSCQSVFAGTTLCSRLSSHDDMCDAGQYAFGCLGGPPLDSCVVLPGGGSVPVTCCP